MVIKSLKSVEWWQRNKRLLLEHQFWDTLISIDNTFLEWNIAFVCASVRLPLQLLGNLTSCANLQYDWILLTKSIIYMISMKFGRLVEEEDNIFCFKFQLISFDYYGVTSHCSKSCYLQCVQKMVPKTNGLYSANLKTN